MGNPVQRTYAKADSGSWIEGFGVVQRLLPDDREGSRHQRFVIDMRNGQTILITHNIELAKRVPLGMGDRIRFRGMYEWNDEGGLLHWTHDDPLGKEDGGFIHYRSKVYR